MATKSITLLLVAMALLSAGPARAKDPPAAVAAFLKEHCFMCHEEDMAEGKLRLDRLTADFASPAIAEPWGRVFSKLEKREMPPKSQPQPPEGQLNWLEPEVRAAVAARLRAQGRVALRRLNRIE